MDELRVETKPDLRPDHRAPDGPRGSRWKPTFWTIVVLALATSLVWWIHTRPAPGPPAGRFAFGAPMPVVVSTVQKGNIDITYNALGTVTALATVTVQSQIAGQLIEVGFKEGQEVKKGDFLAQVDPRPYQAAVDQASGTLLRDQALLNEARIDLTRYQKLAEQNSIARQQAEDQQYVVYQDEGTVKLDQALVDTAKLNLGYCRIVSPLTGRIGLREVDPGNYIQVGNAASSSTSSVSNTNGIAVITEMQPISVIFTLPEDELPAVMKRLSAGATLPVTVFDRSGNTKLEDGTLAAVDSTISTTTGTVNLRSMFDNKDEVLFPNQFVNARLLIDTLKDTTVIPSAAVQRGEPGTFVYLAKQDNTVAVQKVQLGPQDGERIAVKSGLNPGDRVVIDGADKLRDGAKVAIRQESGAPSQPAATGTSAQPAAKPPTTPSQPSPPKNGQ